MRKLQSRITPDLVEHFDRPGPRYTSYPTAPQMHEDFPVSSYVAALVDADPSRPLSLYVHLPFCRSLCHYCGCHMLVTHQHEKIETYLTYLSREIDVIAGQLDPARKVDFVHWGGGTPTYLTPDQIVTLMHKIRQVLPISPTAEASIEADPRTTSPDHLEAIRGAGFGRISLGVQDFNSVVQEAVGRIQPESLVRQVFDGCRQHGFDSIGMDLIYGLPHQTHRSFFDTINRVIDFGPDRISLFSYAHVPWMKKHQRLIPLDALPSPREKLSLLLLAIEGFTDAGFRYVGMDHFAKPSDPLCQAQDEGRLHRNFQGYTTDGHCDVIGCGISSISQLERMYVQNVKGLEDYFAAIDRKDLPVFRGIDLRPDDVIRRHVITRLMCDFALDRASVEARFGIDFDTYFADAVRGLVDLETYELVVDDGLHIRVTDLGRILIRNVAMLFDAYLPETGPARTPAFSRTI